MTEDASHTPPPAEEPLIENPAEPGEATAVDTFAAETEVAETLAAADAVDYHDRWLRAEAELQNFRRRAVRDRDESVRASEERLLGDVLEVLDDLERALASLDAARAGENWAQGVQLTAQRLRDLLVRAGVAPIEALGR